jgi:hypothetical protein
LYWKKDHLFGTVRIGGICVMSVNKQLHNIDFCAEEGKLLKAATPHIMQTVNDCSYIFSATFVDFSTIHAFLLL